MDVSSPASVPVAEPSGPRRSTSTSSTGVAGAGARRDGDELEAVAVGEVAEPLVADRQPVPLRRQGGQRRLHLLVGQGQLVAVVLGRRLPWRGVGAGSLGQRRRDLSGERGVAIGVEPDPGIGGAVDPTGVQDLGGDHHRGTVRLMAGLVDGPGQAHLVGGGVDRHHEIGRGQG